MKDEAGPDKLGFEYLDGPVTPKPEKIPQPAGAKPKRRAPRRNKPPGPKGDGGPAVPARLGAEGAAGQGLTRFRLTRRSIESAHVLASANAAPASAATAPPR